jgi:DNA-binding CsgD family transcriptional regulator/tetratricopeptide (TPR) repeat protein
VSLLERDGQLADLARWRDEASGGRGSVVLVAGEAGAGKTTLVEAFAAQGHLLRGWCQPLVTPRPLGPLLDIAAQFGGGLLEQVRAAVEPYDAFEALRARLAAEPGPTIVLVEDAHWADDATIMMLQFLGRRLDDVPALLVVTYRPEDIPPDHGLQLALADLARQSRTVHRVEVGAFSPDAVSVLTHGTGLDSVAIHRATAGNPFFVSEVVSAGGGLPATVRDAVRGRLARLSKEERLLVDAVAVQPRGLHLDFVRPLLDLDRDVASGTALDGLLVADGPLVSFRHDLARRAVLEDVSGPRLTALHRSMVRLLEAAGQDDPARLAHHAIGCGDSELVAKHAKTAGDEARRRRSFVEAVTFYRAALEYMSSAPSGDRVQLLVALSFVEGVTGDHAMATDTARAAVAVADQTDDPILAGLARTTLARALWPMGDPPASRAMLEDAIGILRDAGPGSELADAQCRASMHAMFARRHAPALRFAHDATATAQACGAAAKLRLARVAEGTTELVTGDPDRGIELLEAALAEARALGEVLLESDCLTMLGSGCGEVRRYDLAATYLDQLTELAHRRDLDYPLAYARAWQARIALERGEWDSAPEFARRVLEAPVQPISRLTALGVIGRLRVRRGDPRAEEALNEALTMSDLELQHRWPSLCAMAELHWLAGQDTEGQDLLAEPYAAALDTDSAWARGEIGFWLWRVGGLDASPDGAAEPFARQMSGDWAAAAESWMAIGCPYEAALALCDGDDPAVARGLIGLDQLGARPAAAFVRARLRRSGRPVPRGRHAITRSHPFGLTPREAEIHELLLAGLSNPDIASRLVLSRRTVEHHVSAVLAKCGAANRDALV